MNAYGERMTAMNARYMHVVMTLADDEPEGAQVSQGNIMGWRIDRRTYTERRRYVAGVRRWACRMTLQSG
jgi:hypothetical protein